MPSLYRMPEVAAGSADALLAEWLVPENTEFAQGDALVTVETDKASVDIEAESSGVMLRDLAEAGTRVDVGDAIAFIADVGQAVPDIDAALAELGVADAAVGVGTPEEDAVTELADANGSSAAATPTPAPGVEPGRRFVTPLVRRLAAENELDLTGVGGTGPNGRMVKRDIIKLLDRAIEPAPQPGQRATTTAATPTQAAPATDPGTLGYVDQPHSRIRKAIATRLTESKNVAPHFYLRG